MTPILETKNLTMQFGGLTAVDNVNFKVNPKEIVALIGPNGAGKTTFFNCVTGLLGAIFLPKSVREEEKKVIQDSYNILVDVGLEKFVNELAKNLPYGAQRRLEIARAMATEPALLLLDEPAAGMNPHETKELDEMILNIRDKSKISILLIEHDMSLVMSISEKIFVVDYGKLIAQGTPDEIKNNPEVIKAYLGDDSDA